MLTIHPEEHPLMSDLSNIPRFLAYAAAFERAYEDDQWSALEKFFSPDAVYEIGLPLLGSERCEGRDAILSWFPDVLDRFDRKFESRELKPLEGPKEEGSEVWLRGSATYRAPGFPDFVLVLEETARFEGDRIVRLEDRYTSEMEAEMRRYLEEHGEKLGLELIVE
jgi:hypothetical protein